MTMQRRTPGTIAANILDGPSHLYSTTPTHARGPEGTLPITPEMLLTQPSGNLSDSRKMPAWLGTTAPARP